MPLMPLLDAFQFRIPWSPGLALNFTVQDHPLPEVQSVLALILDGLTFKVGAAQLHAIGTAFADPLNVKVALAGQTLFGIEIVTRAVWPGGSVPLGKGATDFQEAFAALSDVGYSGHVILQTAFGSDFEGDAAQHLAFVRRLLTS